MKKNKRFIPIAFPEISGNEKSYLLNCLKSSWISSKGEYIDRFEEDFARFIGSKYAVSSSNGTTALHLALVAAGIGPGDEVILPDLTFVATANTVKYTGAEPVLVDVNKKSWQINTRLIEGKINKKTKVLLPVHLYGIPSDMKKIMEIAKKYKLTVIEDAAEAHGAKVMMGDVSFKMAGSIGLMGCFSFYANKIITTGEGGMVVTDDRKKADLMKMLRDHGQDPGRHYYHPLIGFNYRMTNLQAALGTAQLERIQKLLNFKSRIAALYTNMLSKVAGIYFPEIPAGTEAVCWLYSVIVDKPYPLSRDVLIKKLKNRGIETRPFFYPMHRLPAYISEESFPAADYLFHHGINLPSGYNLTEGDIKYICAVIKSFSK
ncbi:hypothetical protein A2777_05815 [Candidatus Gottesmanbacteria bacterium RIFCSPHIGHO2_01_FULL_40_15]|uniref:Aminotransferase DegT n=1 Tax=Candidatus Gottesmanbacteria bacterium RIFCSPHIGHO2_01_FULL_40_15 TaxID=1798376 RepID=A0A1F5Z1Z5_9BACT|nr:MAG: hypothetical protein A2777_05815 [Candidatus Gottesmanbacteria bacterium RIFCSPHIGHO2_01_FULL_40_15]